MMLVAMLAVAGVTVQTVKVYEIVAANKSIREVNMDNRVLENKAANLVIELDFEKRDEVICLQATQMLGMIMPESSRIVVLPGQNAANGNLQIASANIR